MREQRSRDVPRDVREPEVATLEAAGELLVVETEQVQHRRVETADVHAAVPDVRADVVGPVEDLPAFDAAAGHPDAVGEGVVVATGVRFVADAALVRRRAAELARPHDQSKR